MIRKYGWPMHEIVSPGGEPRVESFYGRGAMNHSPEIQSSPRCQTWSKRWMGPGYFFNVQLRFRRPTGMGPTVRNRQVSISKILLMDFVPRSDPLPFRQWRVCGA